MSITLEEAIKLFGKECIPPDVFTDPYQREKWLEYTGELIDEEGEDWVVANKRRRYESWKYVGTLV